MRNAIRSPRFFWIGSLPSRSSIDSNADKVKTSLSETSTASVCLE